MIRFTSLLLSVAAALQVSAQTAEDKPARTVELRMLAFSYQNKVQSLQIFDPATGTALLTEAADLPKYLSEEKHKVALRGDKLVFSTQSDPEKALAEGGASAEVTLPSGMTEAILVFFPAGPDKGVDYRVAPLDGSARAFPAGSIQTMNVSSVPVRMMLEKQLVQLAPGARKLVEDPPVRANNHTGVVVQAHLDGEWRKVASSLWPHPGRKRVFQIIYQDPKSGRMKLEGYRDIAFDSTTAE
ncbi:hypothetical protein HAHE_29530 [Haloferula helveola]|uniref:Uncharacterized protein n=1 Tax=Haloferula helveola TaxID=490095 RepID=A0ABM7RBP3_9BACT|nr:hypothetical protein HAHE_29530 [Haloferula helveola]